MSSGKYSAADSPRPVKRALVARLPTSQDEDGIIDDRHNRKITHLAAAVDAAERLTAVLRQLFQRTILGQNGAAVILKPFGGEDVPLVVEDDKITRIFPLAQQRVG